MHKTILAAVAAAALFAPAVAQQIHMNGQPQTGQEEPQAQAQPQPAPGTPPQAMTGHAIAPQSLNADQIREIQQALQARGNPVQVDGAWGADMEPAIMSFQKSENLISQNGELDPLTLMALGLNPLTFGLSSPNETTGQAVRDSAPQEETIQPQPAEQQPAAGQPIREGEQDR